LRNKLASIGIVLYLKMLIDNFLHGDLHPGNIFVKLDKNNNPSLVVLDVGMVARLKDKDRKNLMKLFTSVVKHRGQDAAECLMEKDQKMVNPMNVELFKEELGEFFDFLADLKTPQIEMGKSFSKCLEVGRKYDIKIDPTMCTALVGSVIMEGLGRQLNPNIDFIRESAPVLLLSNNLRKEYFRERFNEFYSTTKTVVDELEEWVDEWLDRKSPEN
jgi:aarF domain-containing kinase